MLINNQSLWDSLTRKISVYTITQYQKHISPHKGFVCAHRRLYGGESCSEHIKQTIIKEGLGHILAKSKLRFASCKQANFILKSQTEETEEKPQKKKKQSYEDQTCLMDTTDLWCNCVTSGCDSPEMLDCSPDCSSLECGVADCSILDCGSCG